MKPIDDQYISIQSGLNQTRDEYNTISEMYRNLNLRCNAHFLYAVRVVQKDLQGNIIRIWDSLKQVSLELPCSHGTFCNFINGKSKGQYGN